MSTSTSATTETTPDYVAPFPAMEFKVEENTTDSDEIRAYKAQVKEVATRYAKSHNMCGVVNQVLAEVGITPEKPVMIEVKSSLLGSVYLSVTSEEFAGKTAEEQAEIVVKKIGAVTVRGYVTGSKTIEERVFKDSLTSIEVAKRPEGAASTTPRLEWFTFKEDSQRAHAVEIESLEASFQNGGVYSICGSVYVATQNLSAAPSEEERAHCTSCARRVEQVAAHEAEARGETPVAAEPERASNRSRW